jgi:hypothetical protein
MFTVRQMYNLIKLILLISLSYMFRTLNLGSSSGTNYLKLHTTYVSVPAEPSSGGQGYIHITSIS